MRLMLAFSAGALLGDSFLHLIPHVLSTLEYVPAADAARYCGQLVLSGIMIFFVIDKVIRLLVTSHNRISHGAEVNNQPGKKEPANKQNEASKLVQRRVQEKRHDEKRLSTVHEVSESEDYQHSKSPPQECPLSTSGYLNLIADFTHNFTDGISIGVSFAAGNKIGYISAISILLHEIPHELGDYALLVKTGFTPRKAAKLQLVTALGALLGCLLSCYVIRIEMASTVIMALTAGGFIYVAAATIIPELIEPSRSQYEPGLGISLSMALGVACMAVVGYLE